MIKIAILDSGVNYKHTIFKNQEINGFAIKEKNGKIIVTDDFLDVNGHGTAIFHILRESLFPNSNFQIWNIKIFEKKVSTNEKKLNRILEFLCENYHFDCINISFGLSFLKHPEKMINILNSFEERNCKIFAAFNNDGSISYPAIFKNVIGIISKNNVKNNFFLIKDTKKYFFSSIKYFTVPTIGESYQTVMGNSFICPIAIAHFYKNNFISKDVMEYSSAKENDIFSKKEFNIRKAICFPFNKEIQALARFKEKLLFEIVDFFELKYSGMINCKIKNFILDYPNENQLIKDIEDLDVDSFDTLILGYVDKYQGIFENKIKKILLSMIENKKNIFSFQNFEGIDKSIYTPAINKNALKNNFGMLFKILIPVVAIIGSSSRQGKFNLQLYIKLALEKLGYNVGFLGTEPSSELFGADFVFHCGHKTTISLNESETIRCLNFFLNEMQKRRKDIVLTGIQGGVLQYNFNNVEYFTLKQQLFLQAVNPDCMILCINLFDEVEFIKRIIKFSEGITNGKVVCLVCFSILEYIQKNSIFSKNNKQKANKKFNKIGLPIFFIDEEKDIEKIVQILIDYF